MINTIIFDLGGVLIDWNPNYVFDQIFDSEERKRYFFENICTSDWNEQQDAGRSLQEGTEMLVAQHPEWEHEIRAYYGRWREMLGGPIDDTVDILKQIKAADSHRLYALTNWSAETFPIAQELYDFLNWFEGIVVSGVEKTRKPFAGFYQILLDRYRVDPAKAIFIDDNFRNVKAASSLGIHGIHFQSATQLKKELKDRNIL